MDKSWQYSARYSDRHGTERISILNDGQKMRTKIRGVTFTFYSFDDLSPDEGVTPELLSTFEVHDGVLLGYELFVDMPVRLLKGGETASSTLSMTLKLGLPGKDRFYEILTLTLTTSDAKYESKGKSMGFFDGELFDIAKQLPENTHLKCCYGCAYSDYSPYGNGLFGSMMCFRDKKDEYLRVKSKKDFWSVHDHYSQIVQETYYCDEFDVRIPGTGYRG